MRKVEFQTICCAPSQKFTILVIPNVLAHRKSYTKKRDGNKLCTKSSAKSSFDRFFLHHLENSKY
ncbi:hypothetical protein BHE74_00049019 [Ensete ventricosum]|nr:hypothetical protein BHE74_00049019 [Ensete ventricosum]RZS01901.1 hypothetical protein BHM03_00031852 [Ensete ventricosum]